MLDRSQHLTYDGLVQHNLTALVSRFVARVPKGYLVVVYLYPRAPGDIDRLNGLVATHAPSFQVTGVPPVNRELAERAIPQFLKGVTVGTLAVFLFIYFVFRSVRRSLLAFLPTALGFVWSAGLLALLGVELDLFSLFAAMTFIGIGTDYGIHVIYRYCVEGTRPMREVLTRTGTGVLIACATTLVGFGSLINSSYPPLHSFGITSVTTIASCLVASLLVLPALLQEVGDRLVKVCALIAAFNEEPSVGAVVEGVRRFVPDVVVVDDGSTDRTAACAAAAGAFVLTPSGQRRQGGRRAHRPGPRAGQRLLARPADRRRLPARPRGHSRDCWPRESGGCDLVLAERTFVKGSMPTARFYSNRIGSWILSRFIGTDVADTQCGFRLVRTESLRATRLTATGYELETEMLIKLVRQRAVLGHVDIAARYDGARSKLQSVRDTFRTCMMAVRYRYLSRD